MSMQVEMQVGIFTCDAYDVYSSKAMSLHGVVHTRVLKTDLHCPLGGKFHTLMNTPIFVKVWDRVIKDGQFRLQDWSVKADPDTVFFPSRLREVLKDTDLIAAQAGKGKFYNNCKEGLHGPLELLSRRALESYETGAKACKLPPQEDVYLQACLLKLGVGQWDDFNILAEDHCASPDWASCTGKHVSFHPFKTVQAYKECLVNAKEYMSTKG